MKVYGLIISVLLLVHFGECSEPQGLFETSVAQLKSGDFGAAEEGLRGYWLATQDAGNPKDQAVALKWLAQALAAQSREKHQKAIEHLESAEALLKGLDATVYPDATFELGRIYLVKAQLLCLEIVRELRQARLTGVERNSFFDILQK